MRTVRRVIRQIGSIRRGTILIFAIVLLVLLALIGTAYISTTRMDRSSSQTNVINHQIDLLVAGVEQRPQSR